MSQENKPKVAVLLTQVATAEALAATCALNKIKAWVVPSPIGAYAVAQDTNEARIEFLAKSVSALVKSVPAILVVSENGQMKASQWQEGTREGDLPPALVLDGAPHELEDVLFGEVEAGAVEGAIDSGKMGRFKAMRMLAAQAKAYKAKAE
ncbi:hypothetical protein [Timonella senegalensis]|uniref:hypothetical protein n=1 Tax=Timonella senegalensis TaxID=1465825 RepID=UPI000310AB88|nr:hypothetical protein [Timonella senegalensis]